MIEAINELLERDPFLPFCIVTAGGDKYAIHRPRLVAVGQSTIFIYTDGDHFVIVRNSQIASVETLRDAA